LLEAIEFYQTPVGNKTGETHESGTTTTVFTDTQTDPGTVTTFVEGTLTITIVGTSTGIAVTGTTTAFD
jgi:hypothetical protein